MKSFAKYFAFSGAALLCSMAVLAADSAPSSDEVAAPTAQPRWYGVHAGLNFGLGKIGNHGGTVLDRGTDTFAIDVMPGVKVSKFLIGPFFEYQFTGQTADPTDTTATGGFNLKGSAWTLGAGTRYQFNKDIHLLFSYDVLGRYSQSLTTTTGLTSVYKNVIAFPPDGFHFGGGYRVWRMFDVETVFSWERYKSNYLQDVYKDVSSNKLRQWNIGLGVSCAI